jgi:hypothetical protein
MSTIKKCCDKMDKYIEDKDGFFSIELSLGQTGVLLSFNHDYYRQISFCPFCGTKIEIIKDDT